MADIELTDAQRQELRREPGKPVEVIDPATQQRYVLLDREQYERVRPLLEGGPGQGEPSPAPAPLCPQEGEVPRVRLRDLPTPPEVAEEAARWCRKPGLWGKRNRREVEEQLKLQYYYGGQAVYVLRGSEGPIVIAIPERFRDVPGLRYVLLTPEERPHACLEAPSVWGDTSSEILI
jgi:hypothetical protein